MTIYLILLALIIICAGGVVALFTGASYKAATWIGVASSILGAACAIFAAGSALFCGYHTSIHMAWQIPFGSFYIGLDPLSAFFVVTISIVCAIAAIYGAGYLKSYSGRKKIGAAWCFYNLLFASMLLVVIARNGILFLIAWEIMSIVSFFLVIFEHEKKEVRDAGWVYLVAAHIGQACLMCLFIMLAGGNGSLDFDLFSVSADKSALFMLALIGFGVKAGFMPLHVWLPDAHPAAPSNVSAVMSGVMIKTGIYGIIRIIYILGIPAQWWAYTLIVIGAVSAVTGILFAMAQRDIKRLLAYSSVENIGIIISGLGLWLLGLSMNNMVIAGFGLIGALLHLVNHAFFKTLLFFGAGSVVHATGTRNIDLMGGLLKRMPHTALLFGIGAAAICGFPPLNGFISEFFIYISAFNLLTCKVQGGPVEGGLIAIISLCITGGLAAACFSKLFGIIFLGEPRSEHAASAHEANGSMLVPMMIVAILCIFIGLLSPIAIRFIAPVVEQLTGSGNATVPLSMASGLLYKISLAGLSVVVVVSLLWWVRYLLLKGRVNTKGPTWDCGYLFPSYRMQYTASSFSLPVINMFRWIIRPSLNVEIMKGYFPVKGKVSTHTDDIFRKRFFNPIFRFVEVVAHKVHKLQEGRNQLYVLYIAITVLVLLLIKLR
ncbi:MAG: hydrogenase [Deltaproteobacteria bacterium]|nr:hydrogenase [Deltaproteobacteria bacterium]